MTRHSLKYPMTLWGLVGCLTVWSPARVADPRLIRLIATDLRFTAPTEVPAGLTAIRMVNQGQVWHEAILVRLDSSATVQSYVTAAQGGEDFPAGTVDVGGPGLVAMGDSAEVLLDLQPGHYAVVCWADNHVKAGMILALTVKEGAGAGVVAPPADIEVGLKDFSFEFSRLLRAGLQVVKLTNRGARPHEFVVYRFAEGRTLQDFGVWFHTREGMPPAVPVGGSASMVSGRQVWVSLDLPAGHYFVACGVPEGDQIHAQMGMLLEFAID